MLRASLALACIVALAGCATEPRHRPVRLPEILVGRMGEGMTKAFLLSRWAAIGTELAHGRAGENVATAGVFLQCDIGDPWTLARWWDMWMTRDPDAFAEALLVCRRWAAPEQVLVVPER